MIACKCPHCQTGIRGFTTVLPVESWPVLSVSSRSRCLRLRNRQPPRGSPFRLHPRYCTPQVRSIRSLRIRDHGNTALYRWGRKNCGSVLETMAVLCRRRTRSRIRRHCGCRHLFRQDGQAGEREPYSRGKRISALDTALETVEEQKELARQYVQDNIDRLLGGDKAAKEVVGSIPAMDYAFGGRVDTASIGAVTQKYDEHGEAKDCVMNVQVISSGSGGWIPDPRPLSYVVDLWVEVWAGRINASQRFASQGFLLNL